MCCKKLLSLANRPKGQSERVEMVMWTIMVQETNYKWTWDGKEIVIIYKITEYGSFQQRKEGG